MKILYLTHYFPPEGNAPANRVYNLARSWVRAGHAVTVVTGVPNVPAGKVYEGYRNRLYQVEEMDGIRVVRLWTFIAANSGTLLRTLNYLSYLCSAVLWGLFHLRPDIMIATSPQFFCGWAGAKLKWLRRYPFVLEIRDIWPESIEAVGKGMPRLLLRLVGWMETAMYRAADQVVTVGSGYREGLLEKGVPKEKVHVFPNGVDAERFVPGPVDEAFRMKWNPDGKRVIAYVGTIGMASGLDVVLRAARRCRDEGEDGILFLMVGDGAVRQALESEAVRDGLSNVCFTGRQSREDVQLFLKLADVCLVHLKGSALFRRVLPSKIFEAAAMEKPVIIGVEGEASRLVEQAGMGKSMPPGSEDELVRLARESLGDYGPWAEMGRKGRAYLQEHYAIERISEAYLAKLEDWKRQ